MQGCPNALQLGRHCGCVRAPSDPGRNVLLLERSASSSQFTEPQCQPLAKPRPPCLDPLFSRIWSLSSSPKHLLTLSNGHLHRAQGFHSSLSIGPVSRISLHHHNLCIFTWVVPTLVQTNPTPTPISLKKPISLNKLMARVFCVHFSQLVYLCVT